MILFGLNSSSFQFRILCSFFFFVVVSLLVSFQVFWVWKTESELNEINKNITELKTSYLLTYKSEKDFLENELINENFYKTRYSSFINNFNSNLRNSQDKLTTLKKHLNSVNPKLSVKFDSIDALLQVYQKDFLTLTEYLQKRGFRDFGLEGEMRSHIHTLENNFPQFSEVSILKLRRIEKDYLLRKDSSYQKKLYEIYNAELLKIKDKTKNENQKIVFHLNNYYQIFARIVFIDNIIGKDNQSGLRKNLKSNTENIEKLLNEVSIKTSAVLVKKLDSLFNFLIICIFVCIIISIFIAFWLAGLFARPIVLLSSMIQKTVENNFKIDVLKDNPIHSSITEFQMLEKQFLMMNKAIIAYLTEIEEKNKLLTQHNFTLENINTTLSETNLKLKQSESELLQANNVKEKFLSIISHDLRGPLNTLKGFLGIVTDSPDAINDETKQEILNKIKLSVEQQLRLLSNMLQWAKAQFNMVSLDKVQLFLYDEIEAIVKLLEPTAEQKGVSIQLSVDQHVLVYSDKNILELIIRNLISNAIKYSFKGGEILIYATDLQDFIQVSVADQGVGMTFEQIQLVTEQQIQHSTEGTNKEKGTGFGLFFCKEFIEKNGGSMYIQSEPNNGTIISFTLMKPTKN